MAPVAEKVQQEPHWPWFLTLDTAPSATQSTELGASPEAARKRLDDAHGHLRRALEATPSTNGHAPKSKQQ